MDTGKLIEIQSPSVEVKDTEGGSMERVRLVEMGQVSAETKGAYTGLEISLTPKS